MAIRGEIFSSQFMTDKRTYFFNVKENRTGSHFLNIVESKKMPNGEFERHSLMVYEEDMEEFMKELMKAVRFAGKKPDFRGERRPSRRFEQEDDFRSERKPSFRSENRFEKERFDRDRFDREDDFRSERRSEFRSERKPVRKIIRRNDRKPDRKF